MIKLLNKLTTILMLIVISFSLFLTNTFALEDNIDSQTENDYEISLISKNKPEIWLKIENLKTNEEIFNEIEYTLSSNYISVGDALESDYDLDITFDKDKLKIISINGISNDEEYRWVIKFNFSKTEYEGSLFDLYPEDEDYVYIVYEKIEEEQPTYTVTLNPDNGEKEFTLKTNDKGLITKPKDPVKSGYIFKGWYNNEVLFDFNTKVTSDLTLKAKWEKKEETKPKDPNFYEGVTGIEASIVKAHDFVSSQVLNENGEYTKQSYPITNWAYNIGRFAYTNYDVTKLVKQLTTKFPYSKVTTSNLITVAVMFNSVGIDVTHVEWGNEGYKNLLETIENDYNEKTYSYGTVINNSNNYIELVYNLNLQNKYALHALDIMSYYENTKYTSWDKGAILNSSKKPDIITTSNLLKAVIAMKNKGANVSDSLYSHVNEFLTLFYEEYKDDTFGIKASDYSLFDNAASYVDFTIAASHPCGNIIDKLIALQDKQGAYPASYTSYEESYKNPNEPTTTTVLRTLMNYYKNVLGKTINFDDYDLDNKIDVTVKVQIPNSTTMLKESNLKIVNGITAVEALRLLGLQVGEVDGKITSLGYSTGDNKVVGLDRWYPEVNGQEVDYSYVLKNGDILIWKYEHIESKHVNVVFRNGNDLLENLDMGGYFKAGSNLEEIIKSLGATIILDNEGHIISISNGLVTLKNNEYYKWILTIDGKEYTESISSYIPKDREVLTLVYTKIKEEDTTQTDNQNNNESKKPESTNKDKDKEKDDKTETNVENKVKYRFQVGYMVIDQNGKILFKNKFEFNEKKSVMDLLKETKLSYKASECFVGSINGQSGSGYTGWIFEVNGVMPMVSACDYILSNKDVVVWRWSDNDLNFDPDSVFTFDDDNSVTKTDKDGNKVNVNKVGDKYVVTITDKDGKTSKKELTDNELKEEYNDIYEELNKSESNSKEEKDNNSYKYIIISISLILICILLILLFMKKKGNK